MLEPGVRAPCANETCMKAPPPPAPPELPPEPPPPAGAGEIRIAAGGGAAESAPTVVVASYSTPRVADCSGDISLCTSASSSGITRIIRSASCATTTRSPKGEGDGARIPRDAKGVVPRRVIRCGCRTCELRQEQYKKERKKIFSHCTRTMPYFSASRLF